jgi:uncharacterized protein (TIGR02147 family)
MSTDLFESENYHDFLARWIQAQEFAGKKVNFSALTRAAGFSSRSFIHEVIRGRKRITQNSLPRIIKAFKLKGSEAGYFECLVALEEENVEIGLKSKAHIQSELIRLREKVFRNRQRQYLSPEFQTASSTWAFGMLHMADVFAALGSKRRGASLNEILSRTGLSNKICSNILNHFVQKGVVSTSGDRFFASDMNFDLLNLKDNAIFLKYFREALLDLGKKTEAQSALDSLFFHSSFSVERQRLPEFKAKLRTLLLEFIDEIQSDDGEVVSKMTVGLYL